MTEELWVGLGRQQLTLAAGGGAAADAAVDPQSTRLIAAVSQQGLELSTLLVLILAV